MTGALRDPDDLPPITEDMAAQWWDETEAPKGYVGRHTGVDDATLALLVDSRVAWYLGDRDAWNAAHTAAVARLEKRGHSAESAGRLIRHVGEQVDERAVAVMTGLAEVQQALDSAVSVFELWPDAACLDPDGHALSFWDVVGWWRLRRKTGRCGRCGGRLP